MKLSQLLGTTAYMHMMTSSVVGLLIATSVVTADAERQMQASCIICEETQFCGIDNQCHDYSCKNWFQKGGWNYEDIANNTTLACEDYSNGDQEGNYAVVFGCSGYSNVIIPEGEGYGQGFNQKCMATVGMQLFECYNLKPDTDYTTFLSLTSPGTSQNCIDTDGSERPRGFIYQVITMFVHANKSNTVFDGLNSTAFDASLAEVSMYAVATDLKLAPSLSPSMAPPTSLAPSAALRSGAFTVRPFAIMTTLLVFVAAPIVLQV